MSESQNNLKVIVDIMEKNFESEKEITKALQEQTVEMKSMNTTLDKLNDRGIGAICGKFFSSESGQSALKYVIIALLGLLIVMKGFDISFANLLSISQPVEETPITAPADTEPVGDPIQLGSDMPYMTVQRESHLFDIRDVL